MHIYEQKFSFIATLKIMTIPWEQYSNIFHHLLHLNYKHKSRASLKNFQLEFLEHNSVNQCDLYFVLRNYARKRFHTPRIYIKYDCFRFGIIAGFCIIKLNRLQMLSCSFCGGSQETEPMLYRSGTYDKSTSQLVSDFGEVTK